LRWNDYSDPLAESSRTSHGKILSKSHSATFSSNMVFGIPAR